MNKYWVATALTVYGIETELISRMFQHHVQQLLQRLSFTVYTEGGVSEEKESDDEAHTSQVSEQSEDDTKMIR